MQTLSTLILLAASARIVASESYSYSYSYSYADDDGHDGDDGDDHGDDGDDHGNDDGFDCSAYSVEPTKCAEDAMYYTYCQCLDAVAELMAPPTDCPAACGDAVEVFNTVCGPDDESVSALEVYTVFEDEPMFGTCYESIDIPKAIEVVIPVTMAFDGLVVPTDESELEEFVENVQGAIEESISQQFDESVSFAIEIISIDGVEVNPSRRLAAVEIVFDVIINVECDGDCDSQETTSMVETGAADFIDAIQETVDDPTVLNDELSNSLGVTVTVDADSFVAPTFDDVDVEEIGGESSTDAPSAAPAPVETAAPTAAPTDDGEEIDGSAASVKTGVISVAIMAAAAALL